MEDHNKYILTIDVGIKNLAYCLVKYDSTNNDIINNILILDWDIINVSSPHLYCKQIKNKRAICNSIAKTYSLIIDNNNPNDHMDQTNLIGYCKKHSKYIYEQNKLKKKNKDKNTIKLFKISLNPIYKDNFTTQIERLLSNLQSFYNNKITNTYYDVIDNNIKYININNLKIYIENQPVFKNPVMKTISICIYTFFLIKKLENNNIIESINFISAIDKTNKVFIEKISKLFNLNSEISEFKNYDKRKQFAIDISNNIILNIKQNLFNIISIARYITTKKKDDMADTLVYVLYIILVHFHVKI